MNKQYNNLCVVLDPGHAKSTAGKRSPIKEDGTRFYEYKFNRDIVDLLAEMLRSYNIEVFLTTDSTRDGDKDVSLSERANRANKFIKNSGKKGLFISVHADAFKSDWNEANGWTVFTTKGQTNSDKLADCIKFYADLIFKESGKNVRGKKEENFTVIYKSNYPAVLVENFFYTNKEDLEYITSKSGLLDIVNVHLWGILKFADEIYKL